MTYYCRNIGKYTQNLKYYTYSQSEFTLFVNIVSCLWRIREMASNTISLRDERDPNRLRRDCWSFMFSPNHKATITHHPDNTWKLQIYIVYYNTHVYKHIVKYFSNRMIIHVKYFNYHISYLWKTLYSISKCIGLS